MHFEAHRLPAAADIPTVVFSGSLHFTFRYDIAVAPSASSYKLNSKTQKGDHRGSTTRSCIVTQYYTAHRNSVPGLMQVRSPVMLLWVDGAFTRDGTHPDTAEWCKIVQERRGMLTAMIFTSHPYKTITLNGIPWIEDDVSGGMMQYCTRTAQSCLQVVSQARWRQYPDIETEARCDNITHMGLRESGDET